MRSLPWVCLWGTDGRHFLLRSGSRISVQLTSFSVLKTARSRRGPGLEIRVGAKEHQCCWMSETPSQHWRNGLVHCHDEDWWSAFHFLGTFVHNVSWLWGEFGLNSTSQWQRYPVVSEFAGQYRKCQRKSYIKNLLYTPAPLGNRGFFSTFSQPHLIHFFARWFKVVDPGFVPSHNVIQKLLIAMSIPIQQDPCCIYPLLLLFISQDVRHPSRANLLHV